MVITIILRMGIVIKGIQWGLMLALLVGPLLVALIQASLEQGARAGLTVGLGIWISDFICILAAYFGLQHVQQLTASPVFELVLGGVGAIVLIVTGIVTLITPPPDIEAALLENQMSNKTFLGLFSKGFAINTFNPFTIFFWLSIMTGVVNELSYTGPQATAFFTGLMGTIIATDLLKVLMAKRIRYKVRNGHLKRIRLVAGIALLVFAGVLILRLLTF